MYEAILLLLLLLYIYFFLLCYFCSSLLKYSIVKVIFLVWTLLIKIKNCWHNVIILLYTKNSSRYFPRAFAFVRVLLHVSCMYIIIGVRVLS